MAQIGWIQFSSRVDIKHLPLHEQKRKFLIENNSRLQEELHVLNRVHGASGGSAGGSGGVANYSNRWCRFNHRVKLRRGTCRICRV